MELRQLRYVAAVARHRHFTRAADELHVTQSALSQQVRRLEGELGVALLLRAPGGVTLTPAGEDLLARADAILAEAARARADMDAHAGLLRGVVRIAADAAAALALPAPLAAFHRARPGVRIGLRQSAATEVAALVRTGAVDLGVASLPAAAVPGGVHASGLEEEPLLAIAPPGDSLAEAGEIAVWELRERPFVLPEPGSALRAAVLAACAAAGFGPVPLFEAGDPAVVRRLVHEGLGVSLVPASWLRGAAAAGPALVVARLSAPAPRHRQDAVSERGPLLLVDVERDDPQVVAFGVEGGEDRSHRTARRAPRGPEVDEHGQLRFEHVGGEAVVGRRGRGGGRHRSGSCGRD